jgi:hypothetical protein
MRCVYSTYGRVALISEAHQGKSFPAAVCFMKDGGGEGLLVALLLALRVVACGNAFSLRSNRTLIEASHPSRMGRI